MKVYFFFFQVIVYDVRLKSRINFPRRISAFLSCFLLSPPAHINFKFPIEPEKEEIRWRFIKPRMDSKCRAQRRLQREQLAKVESLSQTGAPGRVFRSRYPRVDPREKEELLYGYSRSTEFGLSTPRPQAAECSFQETEAELEDGQSSPVGELPANEAIVEVSGTSVTVEGASSSD